MSKKPNRLGRGLSSLVSNIRSVSPAPPSPAEEEAVDRADVPGLSEQVDASTPGRHSKQAEPVADTNTSALAGEVPAGRGGAVTADVASTAGLDDSGGASLVEAGDLGGAGVSARMVATGSLTLNPFQPRSVASDAGVESLAASLRVSGMIQPITVRLVKGKYQIIAGERRWRAATLAGWESVPVLVREANDQQMLELALVENIQREDLNPMDRARAYGVYCDRFGLSAEQVAKRLGEDRSTVANYLRLLDLEDEICAMVADGRLSMGHARCVVGVADVGIRLRLARAAVVNQLSVRALEEIVRRGKKGLERQGDGLKKEGLIVSPHVREMETMLSQATGTKVRVQIGRRKGSGRMIIEFYSLDDFDRIAGLLGMPPKT